MTEKFTFKCKPNSLMSTFVINVVSPFVAFLWEDTHTKLDLLVTTVLVVYAIVSTTNGCVALPVSTTGWMTTTTPPLCPVTKPQDRLRNKDDDCENLLDGNTRIIMAALCAEAIANRDGRVD